MIMILVEVWIKCLEERKIKGLIFRGDVKGIIKVVIFEFDFERWLIVYKM